MNFTFYKYQGTGNDFIIIDNRKLNFPKDKHDLISHMCNRKYGIGADGLMLLENSEDYDFKMVYYNANGFLGSMCGNGGRCMVKFAKKLAIIDSETIFEAVDGKHEARIANGIVSLKMNDVRNVIIESNFMFLDTGSPHHVEIVEDLKNFEVEEKGSFLRFQKYGKEGANINFVEKIEDNLFAVRTYERGVEAETLSCGTGVTAVAIALAETNKVNKNTVKLKTEGGVLIVSYNKFNGAYKNIYLEGPASFVFKGEWK